MLQALLNVGQEKQHSVFSPFPILLFIIPNLLSSLTSLLLLSLLSSVILLCLSPSTHSPLSVSLQLCCSSPFVTSGGSTRLYGEVNYRVLLLLDAVTLSKPTKEVDAAK